MPIPIRFVKDEEKGNIGVDYSMLLTQPIQKTITASNKDASLLFELWEKSEKSNKPNVVKIDPSSKISSSDILRLKSMGLITSNQNEIEFTKKGRIIITTMSLGESSNFEKNKKKKSYTEILASMSKSNKKGYRTPKFASNNSNNLNLEGL